MTIQKPFPTRDELAPVADKFWSAVSIGSPDECWPWTGKARDGRGYGAFVFGAAKGRGHNLGAHQVAFVLGKENLEIGLCVRHLCDTPACCNPSHLLAGTHKQNMEDMSRRLRVGTRHGHENVAAKLTAEQVSLLIEQYTEGVKILHLSKRFRISCPIIRKILRGQAYKTVPRPGGVVSVYRAFSKR